MTATLLGHVKSKAASCARMKGDFLRRLSRRLSNRLPRRLSEFTKKGVNRLSRSYQTGNLRAGDPTPLAAALLLCIMMHAYPVSSESCHTSSGVAFYLLASSSSGQALARPGEPLGVMMSTWRERRAWP